MVEFQKYTYRGSVVSSQQISSSSKGSRKGGEKRGKQLSLLCFSLGDCEYGTELHVLQQIVRPPPLTWVPRVKSHILGIIPIRGKVVTLMDLRQLMGLEQTSCPPLAGCSSLK